MLEQIHLENALRGMLSLEPPSTALGPMLGQPVKAPTTVGNQQCPDQHQEAAAPTKASIDRVTAPACGYPSHVVGQEMVLHEDL